MPTDTKAKEKTKTDLVPQDKNVVRYLLKAQSYDD